MRRVNRLRSVLLDRDRAAVHKPGAIECAVLVPLIASNSDFEVLYTLRSQHLPDHKGQVAFPGGKRETADENLSATALREAHEEMNIRPETVEILGRLDDVTTVRGLYVVTPYVGLLGETTGLRPNPAEVADSFRLSLAELRDPSHRQSEQMVFEGESYDVEQITAGPHVIWGLTHRITLDLLDCLDA